MADDLTADLTAAWDAGGASTPAAEPTISPANATIPAGGGDTVTPNGGSKDAKPIGGGKDTISPHQAPQPKRDSDGKLRGADGKFASEGAPAAAAPEATKTDQTAPAASAAPAATPPARWSTEEKAEFAKLPPAVQATLARREADRERYFSQQSQKIAAQAQNYAEMDRVLGPRAAQFARMGMSPAMAINQLLALSDEANSAPEKFIMRIARERGIDLANIAKPAEEIYVDPHVKALQDQVSQIASMIGGYQQSQVAATQQTMLSAVHAFANETDATGNLAHPLLREAEDNPHFQGILGEMMDRVPAIRQREPGLSPRDVLQRAYEQAQWLFGPSRQSAMEREIKAAVERATKERQQAAQAAAQGAVSPRTSGPGPASGRPAASDNVEDDLRKAFG